MRDSFAKFNPKVNFVFFLGAVVLGMFFRHPVFVCSSAALALLYYFSIKGKKGLRFLILVMALCAVIAVVNPLFNQMGDHILFSYFGRTFAFEALINGLCTGMLLVTIFTWFACFNAVMTTDRLIYIFAGIAPSIALSASMVLQLLPRFRRKITQLSGARKCIGKGGSRLADQVPVMSAITGWALEGGITTADSMMCRGYGCGTRTTFELYRFDKKNAAVIIFMLVLMAATAFCAAKGGMRADFYPVPDFESFDNPYMLAGMIAYCIFLAFPSVLNIKETISWHYSRSGI